MANDADEVRPGRPDRRVHNRSFFIQGDATPAIRSFANGPFPGVGAELSLVWNGVKAPQRFTRTKIERKNISVQAGNDIRAPPDYADGGSARGQSGAPVLSEIDQEL